MTVQNKFFNFFFNFGGRICSTHFVYFFEFFAEFHFPLFVRISYIIYIYKFHRLLIEVSVSAGMGLDPTQVIALNDFLD